MTPQSDTKMRAAVEAALLREDANSLIDLAIDCVESGNAPAGVPLFQAAIAMGVPVAALNLAYALQKCGRLEEAAATYRVAAEAGDPEAFVNLGIVEGDLGHLEEAERHLRRGLELGAEDALFNLVMHLRLHTDRGDEALELLREASAKGDGEASEYLGNAYEDDGHDDLARAAYELAIEQGRSDSLIDLALHVGDRGEVQLAGEMFARAVALGVEDAANYYGHWLRSNDRADEAERLYRNRLDAGDNSVLLNLGNILTEDPDTAEEGLRYYLRAIAFDDMKAVTNTGIHLQEVGRTLEAEILLRQAAATGDEIAIRALSDESDDDASN